MNKGFYMDGVLDERERILELIEDKISFLKEHYTDGEPEMNTVARLQNLQENIRNTKQRGTNNG